MSENNNGSPNADRNEKYSLNDDRRVKVLSPGALVAKRFFRNRLAVTGIIVLLIMFLFSFVGGIISPYKQDQKFYRVEQSRSSSTGGTGLGLAISKNIVEMHGGTISVTSDLSGTSFIVMLPVHFDIDKEKFANANDRS